MSRLVRVASLLSLALLIAACGGGATTAPTPGPTASPAPTAPPTPTPGSATTPGPESPLPAPRCPEVPEPTGTLCFEVVIRDFAFDPPALTVPTSARVVFVNEDGAPHSVAWEDGTPTSPILATGASTERAFSGAPAGTLAYRCGIHPSMQGTITVDPTIPVP